MADWNCEDILPDGRLPGDLIVSILTNLPAKSLLKFKAVSKPWCSFISSRRFIKMHLRRQSVIANKLLLASVTNKKLCYKFGILSDTNQNDCWKIPPLLSFVADDRYYFLSLCGGLVCLRPTFWGLPFDSFILWNPATRKFRTINSQPYTKLGLGYVEATDDYKIVVGSDIHTSVYSLNSDSWKNLDNADKQFPIGSYLDKKPAFINGRMHWLAYACTCCNVRNKCANVAFRIVAFDVADEVVSWFGIPDNCERLFEFLLEDVRTFVFKGCLSVAKFSIINEMEIWVMEEYGVEGSWVKQFAIPGLPLPRTSLISWNDCEILINKDNRNDMYGVRGMIIFYDLFSKNKYHLEFDSLISFQVFNYVESLASVGTEEENCTFKLVEV